MTAAIDTGFSTDSNSKGAERVRLFAEAMLPEHAESIPAEIGRAHV